MQVVQSLDESKWRQFVNHHPQGSVFHTPEMFRVYQTSEGYKPELWAVLGDDGDILALLIPVQISVLNGLFKRFTTRAVVYGSALCAHSSEGEQALNLLLQKYKYSAGGQVLYTEMRNYSDFCNLQPLLTGQGFQYEDHLNYLIDLNRPLDDIWSDIRSSARRNIKKALRSEVVVEEINEFDTLYSAYRILNSVYKRIQVPLPDVSFFKAAFEILRPQGMLTLLLARVKGAEAGVLALLYHQGVATYWYTGTLRQYSSYRIADLLVWHALQQSQANGCQVFDFGGGGKPDEEYGVRDFKSKYGGKLVNHGRNVLVHSPVRMKISKVGYQLVRRFL